jgi:outer membrane protein assembly factor BamD
MINRCVAVVVLVALALTGCSSTASEESLLTELADMDKQEIFDRAEALYVDKDLAEARRYFSFLYDTFPNDPLGHKAALRVADTYAAKKDTASLTEARLRYRDFANRYPNDPDRDYALLMVGQTYSARHMKPDRDLTTLQEALAAYQQLLALYPDSPYAGEAETRIVDLKEVLAEHELITARFYSRNKKYRATQWRLEYLKEHYPDYSRMDEVDALLEEANSEIDEVTRRIQEMLDKRRAKAAAEGDAEGAAEDGEAGAAAAGDGDGDESRDGGA